MKLPWVKAAEPHKIIVDQDVLNSFFQAFEVVPVLRYGDPETELCHNAPGCSWSVETYLLPRNMLGLVDAAYQHLAVCPHTGQEQT